MMPDLPNVGIERDMEQFVVPCIHFPLLFAQHAMSYNALLYIIAPHILMHHLIALLCEQEFWENPRFRSDGMKIYPTLVIRGTGLYELWKTGRYRSYAPNVLIELVARVLALLPPWCRAFRVQRDIPMPLVSSGVEHGNLREHALARMRELGLRCREVRTREVGIQQIHHKVKPYKVSATRRSFQSSTNIFANFSQ